MVITMMVPTATMITMEMAAITRGDDECDEDDCDDDGYEDAAMREVIGGAATYKVMARTT